MTDESRGKERGCGGAGASTSHNLEDINRKRAELARLIGSLLARHWLAMQNGGDTGHENQIES